MTGAMTGAAIGMTTIADHTVTMTAVAMGTTTIAAKGGDTTVVDGRPSPPAQEIQAAAVISCGDCTTVPEPSIRST